MQTLKLACSSPGPRGLLQSTQYESELLNAGGPGGRQTSGATVVTSSRRAPPRLEFDHHCDECSFHSKSDVSLILHKMNHSIVDQQYVLSATSFTTRNSNSKNIYNCPACDSGSSLTRHEVYRHI